MNAIQINDGDSSMEAAAQSIQNKPQLQHVGMVSPDVNNGCRIHRTLYDLTIDTTNSTSADKEATSIVSPEARRTPPKHTSLLNLVTPSPLKSPLRNSMALLDSKLDSLKKEDVALHAKIESMNAWLDGSGMEDSWDGELCFDGWDFEDDEEESRDALKAVGESTLHEYECCLDDSQGFCESVVAVDVSDPNCNMQIISPLVQQVTSKDDATGLCTDSADGQIVHTMNESTNAAFSDDSTHLQPTTFCAEANPPPDEQWHRLLSEVRASKSIVESSNETSWQAGNISNVTPIPNDDERGLEAVPNKFCGNFHLNFQQTSSQHHSVNGSKEHLVKSSVDLHSSQHVDGSSDSIEMTASDNDSKETINGDSDNDPTCKTDLQNEFTQKHNAIRESTSRLRQNKRIFAHETPDGDDRRIGRGLHCKLPLSSISEIGKVSNAKQPPECDHETSGSEKNNTLFFSPVGTCESRLYLTPYSRNTSVESNPVNLFSNASNTCYEGRCADDCVETQNSLFPFTEKCDSIQTPSLCSIYSSASQAPWTVDQCSFKIESVSDLSQMMSKMAVSSSLSKHDNAIASSNTLQVASNESSSSCSDDFELSTMQKGSPIRPKKLYKSGIVANFTRYKNDNIAPFEQISLAQQNCDDLDATDREQVALVTELHCKSDNAKTCRSTATIDLSSSTHSSSTFQFIAEKVCSNQGYLSQPASPILSSVKTRVLEFDGVEHSELLRVAPRPQHELEQVTTSCETCRREHGDLTIDNERLLGTKAEDEAVINNIENPTAAINREMNLLFVETTPNETIDMGVFPTKKNLDPKCKLCEHHVEQIKSLMVENEKLRTQLEATHQSKLSPQSCHEETSTSPKAPAESLCAHPVDLETLFNATSCNDTVSSTSSSQHVPSAKMSVLEDSLMKAIQSRNHLEELYQQLVQKHCDLECDLTKISSEKNAVIDELKQKSSLVLLLESSHESLIPDKLDAKQQRDILKAQADDFEKQMIRVRTELALADTNCNVADERIRALNSEFLALQSENGNNLKKLKVAEHRLIEACREIELIVDEKRSQEAKIKELLCELTANEKEKTGLQDSLARLSLTISDLRKQILQKESIIDDLSETINHMTDEMTSCFERLKAAESELHWASASNNDALEDPRDLERTPQKVSHHSNDCSISQKEAAAVTKQNLSSPAKSPLHVKGGGSHCRGGIQTDRFQLISGNLSVIVLQQKFREIKAARQLKLTESELFGLQNKLADVELSLGELISDRRRLVEEVVSLKAENATLSVKSDCNVISRYSSEALVLEGECGVEAVDCTPYSSIQLDHGEPDMSLCLSNLRSTIANLAAALVKLKIRECKAKRLLMEKQCQIASLSEKASNFEERFRASTYLINDLQIKNAELLETSSRIPTRVIESPYSEKEIANLEQQIETLKNKVDSDEVSFSRTISELKEYHEEEKRKLSDFIATLNSESSDEIGQLKFYLLHEKEASSLLQGQLDDTVLKQNVLETSLKSLQEENHRLVGSIAAVTAEREALSAKLVECQHAKAMLTQSIESRESESELSEKLRARLQSQLDVENNALNQTVHSQAALIEKMNGQLQALSHERDKEKEALSTMHCKVMSLASERDSLSAQLFSATNEFNVLQSENKSLKHELRTTQDASDGADGNSVRTYSSCEYLGTVSEETRPESPGRDIIEILSASKLSKKDVQIVSDKMRRLHSILSQVQEERASLKEEVKLLREFKESSSQLVTRDQVKLLLRNNSDSYRSRLVESQNEIARLTRELECRHQPTVTKFTSPSTAVHDESDSPQFELSLETPRVSNLVLKQHTKTSPGYRKKKSSQESHAVRSKERFEVKKGISIFGMFKDTKKSGRKDYIKYRDATRDTHSINSSDPISPGEKRKREHEHALMIKSLRRRYQI